jgi:hypothetical protein
VLAFCQSSAAKQSEIHDFKKCLEQIKPLNREKEHGLSLWYHVQRLNKERIMVQLNTSKILFAQKPQSRAACIVPNVHFITAFSKIPQ